MARRREDPVGRTFRIASNQFGYPMFAAPSSGPNPLAADWSDKESDAYLYDSRDNEEMKLSYWKAMAKIIGLDPNSVAIVWG